MKLTFSVDGLNVAVAEVQKQFSERRLRAVAATALTRTANDLAGLWRDGIAGAIDKPTRRTTASVMTKRSTEADLEASVFIKDKAGAAGVAPVEWMTPHEYARPRGLKKFEQALQAQGSMPAGTFAVPTPLAEKDGYGNVRRQLLVQILAQLGTQYSPGYQRVISKSAAKRASKALATGVQYVAVVTRTGRNRSDRPGIYKRTATGFMPIFYYINSINYQKRLSLLGIAEQEAPSMFNGQYARSLRASVDRLNGKG